MFYTKQYFWNELLLEFTTEKMLFYKRSHWLFATWNLVYGTFIHSYAICKRRLSVIQLWLKFSDVKAVMWLVIKAHVIQAGVDLPIRPKVGDCLGPPKAKGPLKCFSYTRCALSADTRMVAVYGVYYHDNRLLVRVEHASCVSCL